MKTNLKESQTWNERFQKSIFDLTEKERQILKQEAKERRLQKQGQEKENSINLCNLSTKRINELEVIANESSVNFVHTENSNSVTVFGKFDNVRKFLRKSRISNNINYLVGLKTSY